MQCPFILPPDYAHRRSRMVVLVLLCLFLGASAAWAAPDAEKTPLLIGLDAEFGLQNSTSAQSIELGARAAIHEINSAGGLLGGRRLQLVTRDNRSIPARGVENLKSLAAMPNLCSASRCAIVWPCLSCWSMQHRVVWIR